MGDAYLDRLRRFYAPRLGADDEAHAVAWSSAEAQRLRFDVLLDVLDPRCASILDVGCGAGHLVEALEARGFAGRYLGVDALPEMVERARARRPDRAFEVAALADLADGPTFDVVVASGVFVVAREDELAAAVPALWARARRAVAFNCLSAWAPVRAPGELHADPVATLALCRLLTPRVALRHDYLPNDFTIHLRRP